MMKQKSMKSFIFLMLKKFASQKSKKKKLPYKVKLAESIALLKQFRCELIYTLRIKKSPLLRGLQRVTIIFIDLS